MAISNTSEVNSMLYTNMYNQLALAVFGTGYRYFWCVMKNRTNCPSHLPLPQGVRQIVMGTTDTGSPGNFRS